MTPLEIGFTPGPYDVICDRGKHARNHIGNKRFRALIEQTMSKYAEASTKHKKSGIVSKIIEKIRSEAGSSGGFVKSVDGVWHDVGDKLVRDKVGQGYRDALHSLYRSSAKRKHVRRVTVGAGIVDVVSQLIQENTFVASRIDKLSEDLNDRGERVPDIFLSQIFTQANLDILEALKKDVTVLPRFHEAEATQKAIVAA